MINHQPDGDHVPTTYGYDFWWYLDGQTPGFSWGKPPSFRGFVRCSTVPPKKPTEGFPSHLQNCITIPDHRWNLVSCPFGKNRGAGSWLIPSIIFWKPVVKGVNLQTPLFSSTNQWEKMGHLWPAHESSMTGCCDFFHIAMDKHQIFHRCSINVEKLPQLFPILGVPKHTPLKDKDLADSVWR